MNNTEKKRLNAFFKKLYDERKPEVDAMLKERRARRAKLKAQRAARPFYYSTDVHFSRANHPGDM